ncbi:nuclear pore complex protein Nup214-like [Liolophura sinensis]|uniref:nuclear pore complex protein Nup214-like n=1 Tax=Liolophura sinensis TaxID=3198878 RepID=UPI0031581852
MLVVVNSSSSTPVFLTSASHERPGLEFRFQQLCKVKISDKWPEQTTGRGQLLTCSSKYGLTFVGGPSGFTVLKTADISHRDGQHPKDKSTVVITDCPVWMNVSTAQPPISLTLSSDDQILLLVMISNDNLVAFFYTINSFSQQGSAAVVRTSYQIDNQGLRLLDSAWNPALPHLLALCLSDGSLALLSVTDKVVVMARLPPSTQATCLCWSPKGKQLVVGKLDGTFSQYDQTLTEKREDHTPTVWSPKGLK